MSGGGMRAFAMHVLHLTMADGRMVSEIRYRGDEKPWPPLLARLPGHVSPNDAEQTILGLRRLAQLTGRGPQSA